MAGQVNRNPTGPSLHMLSFYGVAKAVHAASNHPARLTFQGLRLIPGPWSYSVLDRVSIRRNTSPARQGRWDGTLLGCHAKVVLGTSAVRAAGERVARARW